MEASNQVSRKRIKKLTQIKEHMYPAMKLIPSNQFLLVMPEIHITKDADRELEQNQKETPIPVDNKWYV